ncbi:MAG: protein kinase domain-containing protein [Kofleriaceae bacterium]
MAVGLEDTVAAPSNPVPASNDTPPRVADASVRGTVDVTLSQRAGGSSSSASPGLSAGKQLGHFRIERLLGAGGMGEVYLATDLALDRPVAIKVLPAEMASADRRERLVREARAQARISHPHVAHIYFIGEDGGQLYFAMEYVRGTTVAELVAKGPLPVDDALAIIRAAITGLREANKHGVTHRDVKPSNLMIDDNGIVKLVDFGLAAQREASEDDGEGGVAQTSVAGTPLYMAPEQAFGERVDFRADIYALGATLYHLVSGKPPFEADNAAALRTKHATAIRPPLERRGQARTTVTAVEKLCARMMAPEPDDRFASYDELLRELELTSAEHTRPAGASVRMMSALVDLVTMLVLIGLGTVVVEALGYGPDFNVGPLLIGAIGVLTFLQIARYGRTAGQAAFELEVVDVTTGERPRRSCVAIRVAIPLAFAVASLAVNSVGKLVGWEAFATVGDVLALGFLLVPLSMMWSSARAPNKRTLWDRWSGTMVRYRMHRARLGRAPSQSA